MKAGVRELNAVSNKINTVKALAIILGNWDMQEPRRIGIAGGESMHTATRTAVTGGWVDVLIIDTGTAALLERKSSTMNVRQ